LKKNRFVRTESSDGEVHFQECKNKACATEEQFTEGEALFLAKKEADKPLFLNRRK
jgi:hypothetical protein